MTASQTASRCSIDNDPTDQQLVELTRTCQMLELVRALFGQPILISSGYRCEALNEECGGSENSQHCLGQAADFTSPAAGTPREICERIVADGMIPFDQLILEYGDWVHISQPGIGNQPRRQVLTIDETGTREGLH
jgi:hypothetical protein